MKGLHASIYAFCLFLVACSPVAAPGANETPEPATAVPTEPGPSATSTPAQIPGTPTGEPPAAGPVSITGMTWSAEEHSVQVQLDSWPGVWPGWKMLIDGQEVALEEAAGQLVFRPNAPLDQSPDSLVLGTLPWVTGLDQVDFPCCGTLQFSIPGNGLTNSYPYNLADLGCKTAAQASCPSEWTTHEGDLVIDSGETYRLENTKLLQRGNIYVRDTATLEIVNSELAMDRGDTPTIHVYIFVDPKATLVIDRSRVHPGTDGGLVCVFNHGVTRLKGSPTAIHYFDMSADAQLSMDNSEMIYTIGGLLQVTGGATTVSNSTVGALGLNVPAGAHLDVSGLKSGVTFAHWDVHELIPEADYDLVLDNVTVLKDDFSGELEHGPYERGWIFFLDPQAHVRIADSELRKVFLDLRGDSATFRDLKIGVPSSLTYRDIVLKDVVVQGEWPFTIQDADLTLIDSNYLFLQPQGDSTLRLINSHIVEFIPRDFTGTVIFENGEWDTAGEILGGVDYHSGSNHFTIRGSLKLGENLRENLQWKDAQVDREFEVLVTDAQGAPVPDGSIKVGGKEYPTDANGKATFMMAFDETNYNQPTIVEAWRSGTLFAQRDIDFFTETPLRIQP